MTCVVAVVEKGKVYMGSDSIAVSGYDMDTRSNEKLFLNGQFGIGCCGSLRASDLLRYALAVPPFQSDQHSLHEFMATNFVDAVRETLKQKGALVVKNDEEVVAGNSSFLIAAQGALFTMDSDFQIGVSTHPFAAVGCGASVALGALHATAGQTPRARLRKALQAAQTFNAGVRGPWRFLTV